MSTPPTSVKPSKVHVTLEVEPAAKNTAASRGSHREDVQESVTRRKVDRRA